MVYKETFKPGEVAKLAGCSPATIVKYSRLLGIDPARVGPRRIRRYTAMEAKQICDYLKAGLVERVERNLAAEAGRV